MTQRLVILSSNIHIIWFNVILYISTKKNEAVFATSQEEGTLPGNKISRAIFFSENVT